MAGAAALVGLPGSGKSAIGRRLGQRLQVPFVDTDQVIERRIGCSIRDFFDREGEESFRRIEAEVLADLSTSFQGVLATGGGIVLREANRQCLRSNFHVLYLRSSPEELFRRLRHDSTRPLLQVEDPLRRLGELYSKRDPLYTEIATDIVDTGRPTISAVVNLISMQLEVANVFGGLQGSAEA
ncbi:shikimate kinase I [Burkholderiales bacterium 8X]|nr:shikimate kinase I [Burkholderiales bacterium 8X]